MQSRKTPRIKPERLRRPRGLVQEIVETLAANLREGMIKAGDKLPTESEIMLRFDVSRTVVREALSRLQASHLVETRHGIGTFALPPQDNDNFRITLEDDSTVLGSMIIPRARLNTPSSAPEGRLPYLQRVNQEHESIFVAIRNQDAEAARAAMRTHLSNSKERLRESQAQRLGHTMTDYAPGPISA